VNNIYDINEQSLFLSRARARVRDSGSGRTREMRGNRGGWRGGGEDEGVRVMRD